MILAANNWRTNADLILDCVELGYLKYDDVVLDPTHGRGLWWSKWEPSVLFISKEDFRDLPYDTNTFDAAVFDPPYVSTGGRKTSTLPDFNSRYGLTEAPKTPALLQYHNNLGLSEVARVTKINGYILVKCKDYISSGKYYAGTHWTLVCAIHDLGLQLQDRFEMIGKPGPQPQRTRKDGKPSVQQHARRNLSTLFVFKKGYPE